MSHMPVATLRIWEQRYQAVRPTTAPSGHRLYSPADVQRVLLLRQLTEQGQAIGSIAGLDSAQLQEVANQHAGTTSGAGPRPIRAAAALRLVVVGPALAARLQRPAVAQRLAHPAQVVAVSDSLAEAARTALGTGIDLLIWQSPGLQASVPPELEAAQVAWRAPQVAVVYRFAGAAARKAFADTVAVVVREPADDEALGAWLASLEASFAARAVERAPLSPPLAAPGPSACAVAPRRFDDAALTAIAGLSPTLACECPRHVAELLMQISNFEAYSAGCAHRSPADAQLHAYLQRVAGASRGLFESALESVARHEGLVLR
ncbi:MAG: MerR family transcriptional regulator [Methylibium sp.]|nr:MerR family transcriptional regulator [Methylibium sp.]